jgi:phosphomannomutase
MSQSVQPAGLMVSVSGVRGRVGEALTPELVSAYTAAFGAWARSRGRGRTVVVGRDSRVSGPLFHRVVIGTLVAAGCDVVDVGLAPTPTIQLAVEYHRAAGGLAITASHNPIEWNALKFIDSTGVFLDAESGSAMRALLGTPGRYVSWDALGNVRVDPDAIARHVDLILALPQLDVPGIRSRAFRVAFDGCHGAGGAIVPLLLQRLGCTVAEIGVEPDGFFPRPPEPVAEHLGELETLVRTSKSTVGFATDPDVDRLAIVDETGRAIGEDWTLALATRVLLAHRAGPVVTNLSTSRVLDDVAASAGSHVLRVPVGEVNVALGMREANAVAGGEGNGGVIVPELHLGRDAPAGIALVLQLLHQTGRTLSTIVDEYPKYFILKDKLPRPSAPLVPVYEALAAAFNGAERDTQDGLRLAWRDRWVHIRPSGTEPIVRVIAEAPTVEEARALVQRVREPLDAL